jgi:hypothetical protein
MPVRRWSVRLAVESRVDNALMDAMVSLAHKMRWYGVEFGPSPDEGPETVTIEFDALDGNEARIRAQQMFGRAQEIARSRPRGSTVVWVAPAKDAAESSLRFLGRARELFEEEDYALVVVVAQIHLETQVAALVRLVLGDDPSPLVKVVVKNDRGWAPHDRFGQQVLEALLAVKMSEFPRWEEYKAHVARRNDVAHGGASIDRESSETSLQVVLDLWLWLNDAAQRAPASGDGTPLPSSGGAGSRRGSRE